MRAEFSEMRLRVESLERRIWLHAEGLRVLLYQGDDNLLKTVILNQQIIDKLTELIERRDAEQADS
jgi:hypothetical protein